MFIIYVVHVPIKFPFILIYFETVIWQVNSNMFFVDIDFDSQCVSGQSGQLSFHGSAVSRFHLATPFQ